MVQSAKTDLSEWFDERADEFIAAEKKNTLRLIKYILEEKANEVEKLIFKYVARYMLDKYSLPQTIDGLATGFQYWENLSKSWVKRKGHKRKYYLTGSLINYISARDPSRFYRKGRAKVDYANDSITYESMFDSGRRPFRSVAETRKNEVITQEDKFSYNEYDKNGDPVRPVFEPMEEFLFEKKLNKEIDKWLKKYLEENYE